jgi:pimeloyl-ACP methyl ester carboxylesterase
MQKEKTIELGGGRTLHAVQAGEGPDVVLIHGMLATGRDWLIGPFDGLVEQGCRVTAIDRPGHGGSRRPRFEGTPRDQARQIHSGLKALGIERATLVSHSYGGIVSLAMAELFSEAVAQLVLVAPVAFPEPRLLEHSLLAPRAVPVLGPAFSLGAEATFDRPMLKLVQRLMFSPQPVPADWEARYPYDQVLDPEALVFEGEDSAAILPLSPVGTINVARIATPAYILTGSSDKVVEKERQAKLLARLMPNARLTEVEGVGHMLHHVRPDLVLEAVREALGDPSSRAPRDSVRSSACRN